MNEEEKVSYTRNEHSEYLIKIIYVVSNYCIIYYLFTLQPKYEGILALFIFLSSFLGFMFIVEFIWVYSILIYNKIKYMGVAK